MRIFLTGGTGFIGSHFINAAHGEGHEIRALRRPGSGHPRIPLHREPEWRTAAWADIGERDFDGCDILVHLAAHSANVPYDTLENCIRENVQGPLRLFETAIRSGQRRFLVAGSCFEYGLAGERFTSIPPDAPLEPTATYPTSKAAASVCFSALARERKLEFAILRIFQVFGEGEQESRFWPTLRKRALAGEDMPMTSGEQVRDFVAVQDVARVFVDALHWPLVPGSPVIENLGSGNPQSLRAFAEFWWNHWQASGRLLFGHQPQRPNEIMRFVPQLSDRVRKVLEDALHADLPSIS